MTSSILRTDIESQLKSAAAAVPGTSFLEPTKVGWMITFDDGVRVELKKVSSGRGIFMSSEIGTPPPDRELDILRALLSYTLLWRESGGVVAAFDPASGKFLLQYEWRAKPDQSDQLQVVLENLAGLSRWWARVIAHANEQGTEAIIPFLHADISFRV